MIKQTVTYNDFEGNVVTEDLYFNLTKFEATEFALELPEDLQEVGENMNEANAMESLSKMIDKLGRKGIVDFIKKLVLKAYGVKNPDNRGFDKSEELTRRFANSIAFSEFMMKLLSDDTASAEFVKGVIPSEMAEGLPANVMASIQGETTN